MSSSITHVIEVWKQLNYPELLRDLDRSVTDVAKRQDESDISRKRLVELSREYKRNTHEDIRRPVAPLLKKFQTEIDDLSKRAKAVEAVLLDVFKRLIDLPDPVVALEHAMTIQKKMQRMQDLEIENKQLRETLEEYNTEFAEVKNQEVTIKQLKEKIRELEEEAEETISTRVRERERGLATRYADLERELNERHMEVAAKLRETELKTKTLQTALENTQTELIELKLRYEEVTAAKTDEIDMLVSDMEKANERANAAERQARELQEQLEQRRADRRTEANRSPGLGGESAEEAIRRAELELELNSKEKEIAQLVEEVRRLQSTLKQSQESSSQRVNRLEEELKQKSEELAVLESRVSAREDYDEVKRELDVLRAIEFNTEGATAADGNDPGKPKPLEQLLVEKNKALQNEVTQLKVANQQHVATSSFIPPPSSSPSVLESCVSPATTSPVSQCSSPTSKCSAASSSLAAAAVAISTNSFKTSSFDHLMTTSTSSASTTTSSFVNGVDLSSKTMVFPEACLSACNSPNSALLVTSDSLTLPPLNTFAVAQKVREVLSTNNIGQRLFARHVLGLSQGTVSELLSKPKTWDKLTEKGRDSYRRMHAWVASADQVSALKALAPRKGYSVHFSPANGATSMSANGSLTASPTLSGLASLSGGGGGGGGGGGSSSGGSGAGGTSIVGSGGSYREDQATEEKINAILSEAKRAMDQNGGFAVDATKDHSRTSHQPLLLPKKVAPSPTPNGTNAAAAGVVSFPTVDVKLIETALQMFGFSKPPAAAVDATTSAPPPPPPSTTATTTTTKTATSVPAATAVTNIPLTMSQVKAEPKKEPTKEESVAVALGDVERSAKGAISAVDASLLVRRIYYDELLKISAKASCVGDKASQEKYQKEIQRMERDHPELVSSPAASIGLESGSDATAAAIISAAKSTGSATSAVLASPIAQMTQITKNLTGLSRPFARTLLFGDLGALASGCGASSSVSSGSSGSSGSGGGGGGSGAGAGNKVAGPCDLSRSTGSPQAANKAALVPLSQDFLEQHDAVSTEQVVSRIKDILTLHSISQRVFGEQVLGLSQGSVSDLLARPKAWNMLTHKGREPFIRMKMFLDDPKAIEQLVLSLNPNSTAATAAAATYTPPTVASALRSPADPLVMSKLADTAKAKQAALKLVSAPPLPPARAQPPPAPRPLPKVCPREPLQLKRSVAPLSENMGSNASPVSIYHLAKTSDDVDTLDVSNRIKEVLQINNLGQRLFGEVVLGLSQGSVSELLSKPKPWNQLSIKGREPYIRMQKWLLEVENNDAIEKLKERQKAMRGSRCNKRGQECLYDLSTNNLACAGKKPRVVFSDSQKQVLLSVYNREPYPSSATLEELSRQLGLPLKTINNWFHNHRMRTKMFVAPSTSPIPTAPIGSRGPSPCVASPGGHIGSGVGEGEPMAFDLRVRVKSETEAPEEQEEDSALDLARPSSSASLPASSSASAAAAAAGAGTAGSVQWPAAGVNKRKRSNPTRITVWKQEPVEPADSWPTDTTLHTASATTAATAESSS